MELTRESFLAMVGESEAEPEPGDIYIYIYMSNRAKDQFKTPSLSGTKMPSLSGKKMVKRD